MVSGMQVQLEFEPNTSAQPFSDWRLAEVEVGVGNALSKDFVTILRTSNGGVPIKRYFYLGENDKVVERILSVIDYFKDNPLGMYDIEVVWSQIEGRLNESLVPFAALFAGDFLCFDYSQQPEPSVVLWDHERSDEAAPYTVRVSDSFVDFVQILHG